MLSNENSSSTLSQPRKNFTSNNPPLTPKPCPNPKKAPFYKNLISFPLNKAPPNVKCVLIQIELPSRKI